MKKFAIDLDNINNQKEINLDKYYQDKDLAEFINQNNLTDQDIMQNLGDFQEYLDNKENYQIIWNQGVEIIYHPKLPNPGITYLTKIYFSDSKELNLQELKNNKGLTEAFKKITEGKKGLYLAGANGVGKTHFAVAISNLFYEQTNQKTLYVFWPEFIEISKRFSQDNVHYIQRVKNVKRLIIDDLGQESITSWTRDDILHSIISFRMEKNLTTIITSNYPIEELKELYTLKKIDIKKARSLTEKIKFLTNEFSIVGLNKRDLDK